MDEIYALSLFEPASHDTTTRQEFISCLSIDAQKEAGCNPARIHMGKHYSISLLLCLSLQKFALVYGMSKDFCANGLRAGILVSQHNPVLLSAFTAVLILMKIPSTSEQLWAKLLADKDALAFFLAENVRFSFSRCKIMNS